MTNRAVAGVAGAAVFACSGAVRAATLQWDTDLVTPGAQGGNGAWVTAGPGWWDGTQNVLWTGTTDDAVFDTPSGAVAIAGGVLAASLTFNASGYVVSGGSVALTVGGGLVANAEATISASVGGTAGLLKSGTGALTLSGANTSSGDTTVADGTLRLGAANAAAGPGRSINMLGGTLNLNGLSQNVATLNFGDTVASTAAVVTGPGVLNLSGDINFNGTPEFSMPSARLSAAVNLSSGQHLLDNPPGNLSTDFYDLVIDGAIGGAGGLTKSGSMFTALAATNTYAGPTNVTGSGVLILAAVGAIPSTSAVTVTSPAQLWCYAPFDQAGVVSGGYDQSIGSLSGDGKVSLIAATLTIGSDNTSTTFAGNIADEGSVTKVGGGTLTLTGSANTYTGNTTVSAGKLVFAANYTGGTSLVAQGTGTLQIRPGNGAILRTGSVAASGSGRIDIADSRLIVTAQPVGTVGSGNTYSGVTALIQSGRNGGGWSGSGIVTSQSSATGGNFTSIGVATAQQVKALATATDTAVWSGQTVTGSDVLVMYTYGGDANLDGKINVDDYGRIDSSIPQGIAGWFNGDFNYDGKINVDDYGIIDSNIGTQGAPFPTSAGWPTSVGLSSVPEPASLLLWSACAATLTLHRRRRAASA